MYRILVVAFLVLAHRVFSQSPDSTASQDRLKIGADSFNSFKVIDLDKGLDDQLVSLAEIIEIAKTNSPLLKFQEENIVASEYQVAFAKRQWTQNISMNGSYFYGNQNQLSITNTGDAAGAIIGNGVRYGINVSIPLFEFVARQKRIALYEHQTESYRHRYDELQNEIAKLVIKEYSNLISNQRSLKIQAITREQAVIQKASGEKDFKSGNISITEYSRLTDFQTKAELDYEFWRKEFFLAFYQFEVIVGVKMNELLKKQ